MFTLCKNGYFDAVVALLKRGVNMNTPNKVI